MAVLTPALVALRAAINARCPNRDKASDGWIGDPAHAAGRSSHNPDESGRPEYTDTDTVDEVRAIDVDKDLRADITMQQLIDAILAHEVNRRRLRYVIFNRRIWSAAAGWDRYNGDNPHDQHAHFNGYPDTDNDGSPWPIQGGAMPDSQAMVNTHDRVVAMQTGLPYNGHAAPALYRDVAALAAKVDELSIAVAGLGAVDEATLERVLRRILASVPE